MDEFVQYYVSFKANVLANFKDTAVSEDVTYNLIFSTKLQLRFSG